MSVPDPAITDWVPLSGGAYVPLSTIDAVGDLLVGTGNDAVTRLANPDYWPYTLEADDQVTNKVKWAVRNASYNVAGSRFSSDLNNCKNNGWYHNVAGNTVTNGPAGLATAGFLMYVHGRTNDLGHIIQEIYSVEADATSGLSRKFVRRAVGGASWGPWLAEPVGSSGPGYGTSLPASPTDGQEYILVDSITNPTYTWRFRYNAGSTSPYKWEFIGGPPARSAVDTLEATSSTTYTDLATVGPQLTLVRAGEYEIKLGCYAATGYNGGYPYAYMSPKIGAAAPADVDGILLQAQRTDSQIVSITGSTTAARRKTVAANDLIKCQYRLSVANAGNFGQRWLEISPVRVS